uniref:ZM domain-containing protein n=1 Tax=Panagrellus redivivus TaxID=6233 RepID=A0A7E4VYL8_PANRE
MLIVVTKAMRPVKFDRWTRPSVHSTYPKQWLQTPGLPRDYSEGPPPQKQRRYADYPVHDNQRHCEFNGNSNQGARIHNSPSTTHPHHSSHYHSRHEVTAKSPDSMNRHDYRRPMYPAKGHFYEVDPHFELSRSRSNPNTLPSSNQSNVKGTTTAQQKKQSKEEYQAAIFRAFSLNRAPTVKPPAFTENEDVEMVDLTYVPRDRDQAAEVLDRVFRESR